MTSEAATFEEGVAAATFAIWQRYEAKPSNVSALTVVANFFNTIADEAFGKEHTHFTWLADRFATLGARALWGEVIPTNLVRAKLGDVAELVCRKQHDYGHGNILRFGRDGIIVRLSDKLARLENLTKRYVSAINDRDVPLPANESLQDTWDDIVGYSIIAYMLLTNTFMLPLAADLNAIKTDAVVRRIDSILFDDNDDIRAGLAQ